MNVTIHREKMDDYLDVHGGECALSEVHIYVAEDLDPRVQRNLVIHAIIENYFRSISHDKIEELTDILCDSLDSLDSLLPNPSDQTTDIEIPHQSHRE